MLFTIGQEGLELFFDSGQGRIYYRGRELTKRFGLYTSLLSKGIWHDSQNAIWQVEKVKENKIIAYGEWIYLPIAQVWELKLDNANNFVWRIKMEVYEEIDIEKSQANIMLSPEYNNWTIGNSDKSGIFPNNFGQKWESFYSGEAKTAKMAVNELKKTGKQLLPVLFDCSSMPDDYSISAINTDEIFKARVLSCYKTYKGKNVKFLPGKYEYFIGKIISD